MVLHVHCDFVLGDCVAVAKQYSLEGIYMYSDLVHIDCNLCLKMK